MELPAATLLTAAMVNGWRGATVRYIVVGASSTVIGIFLTTATAISRGAATRPLACATSMIVIIVLCTSATWNFAHQPRIFTSRNAECGERFPRV